jgi:hypothetical protein
MIKYVPLEAILNYIPDAIREQVDAQQIMSWAYLLYRTIEMPISEELKIVDVEVKNHRVKLPDDVKRIINVIHNEPGVDVPKEIVRDYGDGRLIIAQEIFFSSQYYQQARGLKYLGQMKSPLIDEQLYCSRCDVGFSIDKTLSCLHIDYPDGNATLIYYAPVEENGKKMIPDDPDLMLAISHFVQARYWQEKTYSHESNAIALSSDHHIRSRAHLSAFEGRAKLKAINVNKHNVFRLRRNKMYNWNRN